MSVVDIIQYHLAIIGKSTISIVGSHCRRSTAVVVHCLECDASDGNDTNLNLRCVLMQSKQLERLHSEWLALPHIMIYKTT
jgi:hypothetical protein